MSDWIELEERYLMYNAARTPVVLVRGKGARVWDENGREYLDFVAGWATNVLGHCPDVLVEALCRQAETLIHVSNQFYSIPQIELAERLVQQSCFAKVFFGNSGAEANEGAIKLARKYGKLHLNGAYEVVSCLKSFHGRTLAMVAATGKPQYQTAYTPLPAGFINVPYNEIDAIQSVTTAATCAVMVELVQGEGGVNVADRDYVRALREWCDAKGLLLIFDEVQTGIGRTGHLFAYQGYGVEPDIMTLAKGLGGGVAIGAVLAKSHAAVWERGDHGSTFGGNPLACTGAIAVFDEVVKRNLSAQAAAMGDYVHASIERLRQRYAAIVNERGLGLLRAFDLSVERANDLVAAAMEAGLLVNAPGPATIRLMPPLTITERDVDEAMNKLDTALSRTLAA